MSEASRQVRRASVYPGSIYGSRWLGRASIVSTLALGLAVTGSACTGKALSPSSESRPSKAPSSSYESRSSSVHPPVTPSGHISLRQEYPTLLKGYLAEGSCAITVAIWGELDRAHTGIYVEANGQPTAACPHPDVQIAVVCDDVLAGDVIGVDPARVLIRFADWGGGCESEPPMLSSQSPRQSQSPPPIEIL